MYRVVVGEMNDYEINLIKIKAIADVNRLMIVDMLSCGELCACKILEKFNFTQPTLSHHMKVLMEANIIDCRREGKNTYYSLCEKENNDLLEFIKELFSNKKNCICK